MKASVQTIATAVANEKSWAAVFADLFKARLTLLVLITTLVGFYMGSTGPVNGLLLLHTMVGTALLAAGGAALNQLFEREHDAKMRRTCDRPLPSGRLQPSTVLAVGWGAALAGLVYLGVATNVITLVVGAITFFTYVFVYTPLKRVTWLNTLVGAIPGAIPPLMGSTAASGNITREGLALFAIQAFWQIPHFMAISWIYRDEYAKAGFKMLAVLDPDGIRTSQQALSHTIALIALSLCPFLFGLSGPMYLAAAVSLGALFLISAIRFARRLTISSARELFYVSIIYLPLILIVMVLDKAK
jgi:protoheme IX farnesyltransferase